MPVYALHNFDYVIVIMSIVIIMNQCCHLLIPIASHTSRSLCHFQCIVTPRYNLVAHSDIIITSDLL